MRPRDPLRSGVVYDIGTTDDVALIAAEFLRIDGDDAVFATGKVARATINYSLAHDLMTVFHVTAEPLVATRVRKCGFGDIDERSRDGAETFGVRMTDDLPPDLGQTHVVFAVQLPRVLAEHFAVPDVGEEEHSRFIPAAELNAWGVTEHSGGELS